MAELSISNIDSIEKQTIGNDGMFKADVASFTSLLKMTGMGCAVVELEPGKRAWPYHLHYAAEELFVIISGSGTIRYDGKEYPIKAGDVIFTPTGDGTAHQIVNTSGAQLKYLAMSTIGDAELCYYPDSGKYGCYAINSDQQWKKFISHESSETDYYSGEDQES